MFGSLIAQFTIVWYITITTGSVRYLGFLSLASMLPMIVVMLFASVFSDLLNRKILLVAVNILKIISTLILILLFSFEIAGMGILFIFAGLQSIFQAFYLPTLYSIIPTMIPQKQLSRINGLTYLVTILIQLIGPLFAAILLSFFRTDQVLWIELITTGLAIIPLLFVRIPRVGHKQSKTVELKRDSLLVQYFSHFYEGFKVFTLIPGFIILFGSFMLLNILFQPYNIFMPFYVKEIHMGSNLELAILLGIRTFGIIIGAILVLIKKYWNPTILIFFLSACFIVAGMGVIALVPFRSIGVLILNNFIMGFFLVISQTIFLSIMQTNIPKEKLGRVYGIYLAIAYIIVLPGNILLGPFFSIFGIRTGFLIYSLVGLATFIIIIVLSGIRNINFENFIVQKDYFQQSS